MKGLLTLTTKMVIHDFEVNGVDGVIIRGSGDGACEVVKGSYEWWRVIMG